MRVSRYALVAPWLSMVLAIVLTAPAAAQSWSWTYTSTGVQAAHGPAAASLDLSGQTIRTSNRIPIPGHPDVSYGCSIALGDVARAIAVHTGEQSLLIQLKPGHSADCQVIGKTQSVVLRADDPHLIDRVASAINDACCSVARAPVAVVTEAPRKRAPERRETPQPVVRETPTAPPTPKAVARVTPSATPKSVAASREPVMSVEDWVETDGVFAFVRIRNAGNRPLIVTGGDVADCQNVDAGCGTIARRITILPAGVVTFATVASADQHKTPSFDYRYAADMGPYTYNGGGSASKTIPNGAARMSDADIRSAEAAAIAALRTRNGNAGTNNGNGGNKNGSTTALAPPPAPVPQDAPPRVVRAGVAEPVGTRSGILQIRVHLAPDGSPQDAAVLSSTNDDLDDAGVEIAVSSTYAPATHAGRPVPSDFVVTVSFNAGTPSITGGTSAQAGKRT